MGRIRNTLDEVIKAIEECLDSYVAGKIIKSDALHYLKEYKNTEKFYSESIERVVKVIDNYEKMVADYLSDKTCNPPLTWDELEIGKPVWIEWASEDEEDQDLETADCIYKYWCFIYRFLGKDKQIIEVLDCDSDWHQFYKENLGTSWNAYRKERA